MQLVSMIAFLLTRLNRFDYQGYALATSDAGAAKAITFAFGSQCMQ